MFPTPFTVGVPYIYIHLWSLLLIVFARFHRRQTRRTVSAQVQTKESAWTTGRHRHRSRRVRGRPPTATGNDEEQDRQQKVQGVREDHQEASAEETEKGQRVQEARGDRGQVDQERAQQGGQVASRCEGGARGLEGGREAGRVQ